MLLLVLLTRVVPTARLSLSLFITKESVVQISDRFDMSLTVLTFMFCTVQPQMVLVMNLWLRILCTNLKTFVSVYVR